MSPAHGGGDARAVCFPRVSGDEPEVAGAPLTDWEFSPRERG